MGTGGRSSGFAEEEGNDAIRLLGHGAGARTFFPYHTCSTEGKTGSRISFTLSGSYLQAGWQEHKAISSLQLVLDVELTGEGRHPGLHAVHGSPKRWYLVRHGHDI